MSYVTFRYRKPEGYASFIVFLFIFIFIGFQLLNLGRIVDWPFIFYAGLWNGDLTFFFLLTLLVVLELLLFADILLVGLTFRVALTKTGILFSAKTIGLVKFLSKLNPGFFLGHVPYNEIDYIDLDNFSGALKIFRKNNKQVILGARQLENHEQFLEELFGKLAGAQVSKNAAMLRKPQRFRKLSLTIGALGLFIMVAFGMMWVFSLTKPLKATWNSALGSVLIQARSFDKDGSVWAASGDDSSLSRADGFLAWYIPANGGKPQVWHLQVNPCGDHSCYVEAISHNTQGFPRLVFNVDGKYRVYAWDGQRWQVRDLDVDFFTATDSFDTVIWGNKVGKLVRLDFATDSLDEISPPPEASGDKWEIQRRQAQMNDAVLVSYSNEPNNVLALYADNRWQNVIKDIYITEITVDRQGKIWAVLFRGKHNINQVGYFDIEKQTWVWRNLPAREFEIAYFSSLAVDARNRIWLSGTEKISENAGYKDFVTVLDWDETTTLAIVRDYIEDTVELGFSPSVTVSPDGRVWIDDSQLYWIDGTRERLPQPLPAWLVSPLGEQALTNIYGWALYGISIGFMLLAAWLGRK